MSFIDKGTCIQTAFGVDGIDEALDQFFADVNIDSEKLDNPNRLKCFQYPEGHLLIFFIKIHNSKTGKCIIELKRDGCRLLDFLDVYYHAVKFFTGDVRKYVPREPLNVLNPILEDISTSHLEKSLYDLQYISLICANTRSSLMMSGVLKFCSSKMSINSECSRLSLMTIANLMDHSDVIVSTDDILIVLSPDFMRLAYSNVRQVIREMFRVLRATYLRINLRPILMDNRENIKGAIDHIKNMFNSPHKKTHGCIFDVLEWLQL